MSKPTLLEMVQGLLSSISGDEVNSISDTVESEQVARIIKDCYDTTVAELDISDVFGVFELNASGNSAKPVSMSIPSTATDITWVKYDSKNTPSDSMLMREIQYLSLSDFLDMSFMLNTDDTNVGVSTINISGSTIEIPYRKDKAPTYYTMYDATNVLFDSYDSGIDTTLMKAKSLAYGKLSKDFQMLDSWVPPIAENLIPLLMQEAKTQSFNELRQLENNQSQKKAFNLKVKSQIHKRIFGRESPKYPNYARRGAK